MTILRDSGTPRMPFRLEINVCNDPFPSGSPETLEEGRHGSETFASAGDCNAAAKAALEAWLNANCSQWEPAGVTSGTFEGDDSGVKGGGANQKRHKNLSSAKFAMACRAGLRVLARMSRH